jgi:hypothetical protein
MGLSRSCATAPHSGSRNLSLAKVKVGSGCLPPRFLSSCFARRVTAHVLGEARSGKSMPDYPTPKVVASVGSTPFTLTIKQ